MLKKKMWANFHRIIELFTQKIVIKLSKIWVWDPGSGIRDPGSEIRDPRSGIRKKPIPDPRGRKGTGSRIRIRNTGLLNNNNKSRNANAGDFNYLQVI